jgi:hypothetical protein
MVKMLGAEVSETLKNRLKVQSAQMGELVQRGRKP